MRGINWQNKKFADIYTTWGRIDGKDFAVLLWLGEVFSLFESTLFSYIVQADRGMANVLYNRCCNVSIRRQLCMMIPEK